MVEDCLDGVVWGAIQLVLSASGWLNENCLGHFAVSLLNQNPRMQPRFAVGVWLLVVGLVVVDRDCLELSHALLCLLDVGDLLIPNGHVGRFDVNTVALHLVSLSFDPCDHLLLVFIESMVLFLHEVVEAQPKRTVH